MAVLAEAVSVIVRADSIENMVSSGDMKPTPAISRSVQSVEFWTHPMNASHPPGNLCQQSVRQPGRAAHCAQGRQRKLLASCEWAEFGNIPWQGDDSG
jgi:hypothetical protein